MATNLKRGDECVVATPDASGNIVFSWFSFSHKAVMPAEDGIGVRVLFGEWLRSDTLSRADAVATEPYSVFFNVNGHFRRPSVISPRGRRTGQAAMRRG
jgi:hypothetical protein